MKHRFVDSTLSEKSVAETNLGLWVIGLNRYRSLAMEDCGIDFPFLEKSVAKVIIGVGKIRAQFQRFPVMSNRFVNLVLLCKDDAQIVMSHPAIRVSGNCGPPERFDVSVHRALT